MKCRFRPRGVDSYQMYMRRASSPAFMISAYSLFRILEMGITPVKPVGCAAGSDRVSYASRIDGITIKSHEWHIGLEMSNFQSRGFCQSLSPSTSWVSCVLGPTPLGRALLRLFCPDVTARSPTYLSPGHGALQTGHCSAFCTRKKLRMQWSCNRPGQSRLPQRCPYPVRYLNT